MVNYGAIQGSHKTTIEYHIYSKKHIKNKTESPSRNIEEFIGLETDPLKDLILTAPCTGIPIYSDLQKC